MLFCFPFILFFVFNQKAYILRPKYFENRQDHLAMAMVKIYETLQQQIYQAIHYRYFC